MLPKMEHFLRIMIELNADIPIDFDGTLNTEKEDFVC